MKRFLPILLCGLLLLNVDTFARGGGFSSGGSRSSSFSASKSSFFSAPKASVAPSKPSGSIFSKPSTPAPAIAPATVKQGSTFSNPAVVSTPVVAAKPVAVANTQLSNKMAKQDAIGAKKFTSKDDAASAYRQEQATKYSNHFAAEPKTRPDYIPSDISRGTTHYHVVYHGGCYGYYTGSMWTPLDMAMYMVVTDAMLNSNPTYGYGVYQQPVTYQQPVAQPIVYSDPAGNSSHTGRTVLIVLAAVGILGLATILIVRVL